MVAAVFKRHNQFLACKRKQGLSNAGQWEFPGGKRNTNEDFVSALVREIDEELQVQIVVGDSLGSETYNYPDKIIELHCFIVEQWTGDFVPTDHDELQWCSIAQLATVNFSAADVVFVNRIRKHYLPG